MPLEIRGFDPHTASPAAFAAVNAFENRAQAEHYPEDPPHTPQPREARVLQRTCVQS